MADLVWPVCSDFNVTRRARRRAAQSPAEGGPVRRRQIVDREWPQYVLRNRNARRGEISVLEHAWKETKRGVLPVLYTPPDEAQVRCRIAAFDVSWNGVRGSAEVVLEVIR